MTACDITELDVSENEWIDSWEFSATLRRRVQQQLAQSKIQLHWQISNSAKMRQSLIPQILIILEELVSNVLRHSQANILRVEYLTMNLVNRDGHAFSFTDNGKGFLVEDVLPRRGLPKMRQIAEALEGKLIVLSNNDGTQVKFWLPDYK